MQCSTALCFFLYCVIFSLLNFGVYNFAKIIRLDLTCSYTHLLFPNCLHLVINIDDMTPQIYIILIFTY